MTSPDQNYSEPAVEAAATRTGTICSEYILKVKQDGVIRSAAE
jgi:hypothetical protein